MEINLKIIKIKDSSTNKWFYVIGIGDIHLGNVGCDLSKLRSQVEYIKNKKDCYWIGMGDYLDCINYTDKRFDPDIIAKPYINRLANCIPLQIKELAKILDPIKNKCLGLHRGNHEEKIRLQHQYDVVYELCRTWNFEVPDLQDSAITRLRFQKEGKGKQPSYAFDIFSTHGNVGGRKGGAKVNRLEDMIGYIDADIYLIAHSHTKLTSSRAVLFVDNNLNLRHKKRILAVTGCFLNGYTQGVSNYVEKWNYPPTSTGCIKLMFNPRKHDVHISE